MNSPNTDGFSSLDALLEIGNNDPRTAASFEDVGRYLAGLDIITAAIGMALMEIIGPQFADALERHVLLVAQAYAVQDAEAAEEGSNG